MTIHDEGGGFVIWFTGLPAAGKTTIAGLVAEDLRRRGRRVEELDGDAFRTALSRDLGYSKADRDLNVERLAWVASRLAGVGAAVVVSAIAPYREARSRARTIVQEHAPFVEAYVATPLEACIRRDPKGLYARALQGELPDFTGVSAPYEEPTSPDIRLETTSDSPAMCLDVVMQALERLGLAARR